MASIPGDWADPKGGENFVSPLRVIEHRWAEDGWDPFDRKVVNQDGAQAFALSVNGDYGRVTGAGAGAGNQREMYVHRSAQWIDGEVTAVLKGPSTYVSSPSVNRPQAGIVLRYQQIGNHHVGFVVWYDIFAGNPRVLNISGWRGDGSPTLNQAAGGQYTAEIARDLRVLGVQRVPGFFVAEYACQPFHLHGLASGDLVTTDVNDDAFDATAQPVLNPDRENGTFQLNLGAGSELAYKAADGSVVLADNHKRFFPYVLKARLIGNTLSVKAWRGLGHEAEPPDWQAKVTVATDADFPELPEGPGLFGVVVAHAHDGSFAEFGDVTFRRF